MSLDNEKWKRRAQALTDSELRQALCDLEADKISTIEQVGEMHPYVHHITMMLDVICGELLRREKLFRNSPEPRWSVPPCPDTVEKLLALGDGSIGLDGESS